MRKPNLFIILLFTFSSIHSQEDFMILKKGNKSIKKFWKGDFIAFQTENKMWEKGEITRIKDDSFYIRPMVVKYSLMRTDTFYYPVKAFTIADIYSLPKRGVLVDYIDGRFQISKTGGHQHFLWIKNGFIFKLAGGGLIVVGIVNGYIQAVGLGATIFLGAVLLHKLYKHTIRLRGKYRMETFKLSLSPIKSITP